MNECRTNELRKRMFWIQEKKIIEDGIALSLYTQLLREGGEESRDSMDQGLWTRTHVIFLV